jgi:hypothetical protein
MASEINLAIQELYAAFSRPQPPKEVHGCPCCTTAAEVEPLTRVALRELSPEQLEAYASKALTTIGTVDDFRYFLPRVFELAVNGGLQTAKEILLDKPAYGHWRTWPAREQAALERFAAALAGTFATQVYEDYELDAWVCGLGHLLEDLPDSLAPLLTSAASAAENLVRLYELNRGDLKRGTLWNAFWRDCPRAAQLIGWFQRTDVEQAIDMAYVRRHGFGALDADQGDQQDEME